MPIRALLWLCAFVVGGIASFSEPIFGLLTYLLDYYAHPPLRWWGQALPNFRWSLITTAILAGALLIKGRWFLGRETMRHAQTKWLLAFLAVAAAVTPLAVSRESTLHFLGSLAKLVLLYLLIVGAIRTPKHYRYVVLAMVLGAFLWGFDSWIDPHMRSGRLERVGGPDCFNDNSAAAHLLTALPFIGILFAKGRGWHRMIALGAAPFVMNAIIQCNSRGASVAIAVAAVFAVLLAKGRFRLQVAGLGILASVLAFNLMSQTFIERQITLAQYEEDGSAMGRIESWKGALRLIGDHPLGTGGGGFDILSPVYIPDVVAAHGGEERAVHNTYLWVASDWGILGLVCFIGIIVSTLLELHRIRRDSPDPGIQSDSYAIEVAFIGFLVAAIFINRPYAEIFYWLIALTAALRNIQIGQEVMIRSEAAA